ncbi:hypothetical protein [Natrinema altunense]|uniref:Uncharacterized protein n=1 Tax=Natrinema altunense TaxID=222984 RepID=A0A482Y019_9EURY|nr:hypothetical protein [Natrinema altunense]RZH67714.1 hypothetical protein ELS17_10350 [Natrinema altunense]
MSNEEKRRRNVLQSIATVGVGITGGIAANGTAKAEYTRPPGSGDGDGGGGGSGGPSDHGEITIESISNDWEYTIITPTYSGHELQKGDKAEDSDTEGYIANGEIYEGYLDNFWLHSDSAVKKIKVTILDDSGSPIGFVEIEITHGPKNGEIRVSRDKNPDQDYYYYLCEFEQGNLGSTGMQNSPDSIDEDPSGGTVGSYLSDDDNREEFYRSAKHPDLIKIEDEESGGTLKITLPN